MPTVGVWHQLAMELAKVTQEQVVVAGAGLEENEDTEGFHAVGVVSEGDVIRLLWTLKEIHIDQYNTWVDDLGYPKKIGRNKEVAQLRFLLGRIAGRIGILEETIWNETRGRFVELSDRPVIGIRAGWKVGWVEEETTPDHVVTAVFLPPELAALLMGGNGKKGH